MLLDNLKLILHSHLEEGEIPEIRWSSKYLAANDKDKARNLYCLETRIDGLTDDDVLDEQAVHLLKNIAWKLCDGRLGKAYLVLVEHQSLPKSRVRSYKGLFPSAGKIKQGEYIEFEFELEAGWTFFAGMTPITKANKENCFAFTRDYTRAFLLITCGQTINIYSRDYLESILPYLFTRGSISFNYFKLIPEVCSQSLVISSFASDQEGDYRHITSFFNTEVKELVEQAMNSAVNEVDLYRGAYQIKPAPYAP